MARILVVEDEAPIRLGLCDALSFHGFDVVGVGDGEAGLAEGASGRYELLLLDVMLPGVDGLEVCRRLREASPSLPIVLLTARGAEAHVLEGFAAGADDYVTKPFSVAQLVARVQALLRRAGVQGSRAFGLGPVRVDADTLEIAGERGRVPLTPRDVEVLAYLADRRGRIVSREELLTSVWGYQRADRVETRCVDMHLSKLRRKIAGATETNVIETVRGAGYRLAAA